MAVSQPTISYEVVGFLLHLQTTNKNKTMLKSIQIFLINEFVLAAQKAYSTNGRAFPSIDIPLSIDDVDSKTFREAFPGIEALALGHIESDLLFKRIFVSESDLRNKNLGEVIGNVIAQSPFDFASVDPDITSPYVDADPVQADLEGLGPVVATQPKVMDWSTKEIKEQAPKVIPPLDASAPASVKTFDWESLEEPQAAVRPVKKKGTPDPKLLSELFDIKIQELRDEYPGCIIVGLFRPYKTTQEQLDDYTYTEIKKTDEEKDKAFDEAALNEDLIQKIEEEILELGILDDVIESTKERLLNVSALDFSGAPTSDLTTPGFKKGISLTIGKGPDDEFDEEDYNEEPEFYDPEGNVEEELDNNEIVPVVARIGSLEFGLKAKGNYFEFPNNPGNPGVLDTTKKFFVVPTATLDEELQDEIRELYNNIEVDTSDYSL